METASKIHAAPATKTVANTAGPGGGSMPAAPVLQQKPKEQQEKPQTMPSLTAAPVSRYAAQAAPPPPGDNAKRTAAARLPVVPVLQQKPKEQEEKPLNLPAFDRAPLTRFVPAPPPTEDNTRHKPFTLQMKKTEAPLPAEPLARFNPIQKKENNTGMPDNLKTGIENLSGFSMDDVKVRYNSDEPAQLQAHAYAQGTDIHIAPGQEHHLPHEAWHVVQQKQGRVQATMQSHFKTNAAPPREKVGEIFQLSSHLTNDMNRALTRSNSPSSSRNTSSTQVTSESQTPPQPSNDVEVPIGEMLSGNGKFFTKGLGGCIAIAGKKDSHVVFFHYDTTAGSGNIEPVIDIGAETINDSVLTGIKEKMEHNVRQLKYQIVLGNEWEKNGILKKLKKAFVEKLQNCFATTVNPKAGKNAKWDGNTLSAY